MPLVIGAFNTLVEAERATQALLDAGFDQDTITAMSRTGGGRLLLAGRVGVQPIGEPAKLGDRSERAGATAVVGAVLAALVAALVLFLLPRFGIDALAGMRGVVPDLILTAIVVTAAALAGGGLGALARRSSGLPHDLSLRYALRLDQGDTVLAVRAGNAAQARAAQDTLALNGAIFAHVTRGALEPG